MDQATFERELAKLREQAADTTERFAFSPSDLLPVCPTIRAGHISIITTFTIPAGPPVA
jgi:hypothetical protein